MRHCWLILISFLCLACVAQAHAVPPDRPPVVQNQEAKNMITKDAQKAIDAGLAYLAKGQADVGSWGTGQYSGNVAVTSLAGLAFLSGNHHSDRGQYGKAVTKAVRYLLSQESKDTPGFFTSKGGAFHGPMYGNGFTVLFLADAHGTITDKKLKTEVKEALERAVRLIIRAQNAEGGWRYQPRPIDADLSVTAVQVVALRAARDVGFEVPKRALDMAAQYVKSCQHKDDGGFRYQSFGGTSGFARTAAGLTSLNRLGVKDGEAVDKGMGYLRKFDLKNADAVTTMHYSYGHYHAAKAMWYKGGKEWQAWFPVVRDELTKRQKDDCWTEGLMTPHYSTAVALIILQMPHANLPSLKR
jgi:hypothetical protein